MTPPSPAPASRLLACLLLVLLAPLAASAAPDAPPRERWYVLMLQGQRAGHMRAFERTEGDTIYTGSEMTLEVKRGAASVQLRFETRSEESAAGEPKKLETLAQLGFQPIRKTYLFTPDAITLTSDQAGTLTTQRLDLPARAWLTPAAADRSVRAQLAANAQTIDTRTLEDTFTGGLATVTTTRRVLEHASVEALGRTVPGIRWSVSLDLLPTAKSEEWVDEQGELIRGTIDLGGIQLQQILADRDLALSKLNPPELLVSTLVRPSRPIQRPRQTRSADYLLRVKDGTLPDLPTGAGQRVERTDATHIRVRINAAGWGDPAPGPADADTSPSTMINGNDELIAKLAATALRESATPDARDPAHHPAQAEALRRFVHIFIHAKSLDVGFASASETARTRSGDCTEHAVLLAATLRARGIPARVVSGLVFGEAFAGETNIFGYHLWTRAWLPSADGPSRWVDLDATLSPSIPFDATHIALSESALGDDQSGNAMINLAPLLGRLEIDVEHTE